MSIVLERISKRYGSQWVVDHVSLEVANRELFVLLGSSGKSTILRMIAGLSSPTSGRILLHGRDVTGLTPQERGTGFVFQNYSIFRHMSVSDNIEFGLRIRKVAKDDRKRRREPLLDLVGLAGLGNRFAHQLSGGQQQRVALARALAYEPDVPVARRAIRRARREDSRAAPAKPQRDSAAARSDHNSCDSRPRGVLRACIIIGSHGRRARSFFELNEVMLEVLAGSDRPVLIVPTDRI